MTPVSGSTVHFGANYSAVDAMDFQRAIYYWFEVLNFDTELDNKHLQSCEYSLCKSGKTQFTMNTERIIES